MIFNADNNRYRHNPFKFKAKHFELKLLINNSLQKIPLFKVLKMTSIYNVCKLEY